MLGEHVVHITLDHLLVVRVWVSRSRRMTERCLASKPLQVQLLNPLPGSYAGSL